MDKEGEGEATDGLLFDVSVRVVSVGEMGPFSSSFCSPYGDSGFVVG